ncbi:LysR family transcriptional regulator [Massilia endophytica]|uniref:LysR family transcriptional regulator n=1 Tax=Massilia endophytica TaxID=2899220 RepID=UPI001E5749E7|nr:LysR family transcriptional regulator [Massilia endophytica]UGQ47539.1 LysR family transcriptional regulator [Massilia endophytica]
MTAKPQYSMNASDLALVLALTRGGTLAEAGARLGVDASTAFRSLQKIERGLGTRLFARSRAGYAPTELALALAQRAEQIEALLEDARSAAQLKTEQVAGTVRISTTDTVLHGLVAPALGALRKAHPLLSYELHTGNELANLTRRDADIAVRATMRPPQHLVGKCVGPIRVALYASGKARWRHEDAVSGASPWIAPDDALPEHPSVVWRKRRLAKITPTYRVNSILSVAELVGQGLGVGLLPVFLARRMPGLRQLTEEIDECRTELWLLTHPEARHLRRVGTVYEHLANQLLLD